MFLTSSTIRKRKDTGKWQVIIRQKQNGTRKQVESKTFVGSTEAKQWATNKKAEWQRKIETDYDKMTIGQLKEIYLETKKKEVKHSTYLTVASNIRNANWLDDKLVYQVTTHDIKNICRDASYSHVKYMRMFYNFLIEELGIKVDNPFYKKQPKKESKTFIVTDEDLEFILNRTRDEVVYISIIILYYTGIRISELNGLTWNNITKDSITINKQLYTSNKTFSDTKSINSDRVIPINNKLIKHLQWWRRFQKITNIDNRLFTLKALEQKVNKQLRKILKNTYLEGLTCHDFRHTFITKLIQNNVDLITVAYLAGDDLNTIIKNYAHVNKKTKELSKQAIQSL